ncbi:hypothetical protein FSP39_001326, partial [Pinctada imbricata]
FCQELVVTHAPSYVQFQQQKEKLQTSDVPHVISQTLGIPNTVNINWKGLAQGSLFKRPKANVLVSLVGYDGMDKNPIPLKSITKFPVSPDIPMVDTGFLMNTIQSNFFDKNPLLLDAGLDNNFFDVHTDFDIFRKLPDTMRRMADRLLDPDSVLQQHSTGMLNSSSPVHLKMMGELQLIQDVVNTVQDKPEMLKSKSPDSYTFTVTGLRDIATKHGSNSPEVTDAQKLFADFIEKITNDLRKLYKDNVVVEVLTLNPEKATLIRKVRSLKATGDTEAKSLNLSNDYDEDYPAIFNIILWFMIVLFIFLFLVSYAMWNMDPGRDSIIYRMTTTRLKKD